MNFRILPGYRFWTLQPCFKLQFNIGSGWNTVARFDTLEEAIAWKRALEKANKEGA